MKKVFILLAAAAICSGCCKKPAAVESFPELDQFVEQCHTNVVNSIGYPATQCNSELHAFYKWYLASGMDIININNAGDPFSEEEGYTMSSQHFEREVLEFFAPYYGFDKDSVWGLVTHSGTDGNNHGIYFGANILYGKTGKQPIVYVSDEAHYSNMRLCDLQNLDVRLVKSDEMGRMIPEELEKALDPSRPCLMVYAMGSTFKGAIDDMETLNAVLAKYPDMPVFRHVDAALFGGYLPFTEYRDMVNCKKMHFESIAVSGHKFFGIDSPSGLFLTTRDVYDNQDSFDVPYLNSSMKMINCSRDAVQPLKFWWLIHRVGAEGWSKQANQMLECADYLKAELTKIGCPCWSNEYSNTVFFRRPSAEMVVKYNLACGHDDHFGGDLAHVVVMQHVTHDAIDRFVAELQAENK